MSSNWQTAVPPKPKVVPVGDADTLLGQLQIANGSLEKVANPAPQNVRPESIPTQSALYMDSGWNVIFNTFTSISSDPGQAATIRYMDLSGNIYGYQVAMNYNATLRKLSVTTFAAPFEGWLLAVEMGGSTAGATKRGQYYVLCYVQTATFTVGPGGNPTGSNLILFEDYVSAGYSPSWPNGRFIAPTEGPGYIYNPQPANPVAGAEISVTVPTGARWRIVSLQATLTTDAVVANRQLFFYFTDALGNNFLYSAPYPVVAAGTTRYFSMYGGYPMIDTTYDAQGIARQPLPQGLILTAGTKIQTVVFNFDAGDQLSITGAYWGLIVEEWLEP